MAKKSVTVESAFTASQESAVSEVRVQLERSYELVRSAVSAIKEGCPDSALTLLDMADDILADRQYINRISRPEPGLDWDVVQHPESRGA